MNERIKKLYEQAMEPNGIEGLGGSYMELNPEKFAELIIRECCNIFVELRTRPADLAVLDVKKHFGIE